MMRVQPVLLTVGFTVLCLALLASTLTVPTSVSSQGSAYQQFLPAVVSQGKHQDLLPEDRITRVAVDFAGTTYHYDLYEPKGYAADASRRYPVLFIASPGGNATLGNAEAWVKENQWLAVMLVESRNGPSQPRVDNFLAAHDDVLRRVRVDENMKFATGVSGGAFVSALQVHLRPGFRGLVTQATGGDTVNVGNMRTFAAIGAQDFNFWYFEQVKEQMPPELYHFEVFPGGHEPAPVDVMNRAFAWLTEDIRPEAYAISGGIRAGLHQDGTSCAYDAVVLLAPAGPTAIKAPLYDWYWYDRFIEADPIGGSSWYTLNGLEPGVYTMQISAPGCRFEEPVREVTVTNRSVKADFIEQSYFSVSGSVTHANGLPFANLQVGAGYYPITRTSDSGYYELSWYLQRYQTITVNFEPRHPAFTFSPEEHAVMLPPDAYGQDFVALPNAVHAYVELGNQDTVAFSDGQGLSTTVTLSTGMPSIGFSLHITPTIIQPPPGMAFTGHAFELTATEVNQPVPPTAYIVKIQYSDFDIRLVAEEQRLALYQQVDEGWVDAAEPCTPGTTYVHDVTANVLEVGICADGIYALLGPGE